MNQIPATRHEMGLDAVSFPEIQNVPVFFPQASDGLADGTASARLTVKTVADSSYNRYSRPLSGNSAPPLKGVDREPKEEYQVIHFTLILQKFTECFGKKLIYSWKWASMSLADRHHIFVRFLAIALWSAALLVAACERKAPEATSLLEKPTVSKMSEPIVRGEIVVKFKPSVSQERIDAILKESGTELITEIKGIGFHHVRIVGEESVESVVKQLSTFQGG